MPITRTVTPDMASMPYAEREERLRFLAEAMQNAVESAAEPMSVRDLMGAVVRASKSPFSDVRYALTYARSLGLIKVNVREDTVSTL